MVCVAGACQHGSQMLLQFNGQPGVPSFSFAGPEHGEGPGGAESPPPPHPNEFGRHV